MQEAQTPTERDVAVLDVLAMVLRGSPTTWDHVEEATGVSEKFPNLQDALIQEGLISMGRYGYLMATEEGRAVHARLSEVIQVERRPLRNVPRQERVESVEWTMPSDIRLRGLHISPEPVVLDDAAVDYILQNFSHRYDLTFAHVAEDLDLPMDYQPVYEGQLVQRGVLRVDPQGVWQLTPPPRQAGAGPVPQRNGSRPVSYGSARRIPGIAVAAIVLSGLLALVSLGGGLIDLAAALSLSSALKSAPDGGISAAQRYDVLSLLTFFAWAGVFLPFIVVFGVWLSKVKGLADSFARTSWAPAWGIGGWFVPILALFVPAAVLRNATRVLNAVVSGDARRWSRSYPVMGNMGWWLSFLFGEFLINLGRQLPDRLALSDTGLASSDLSTLLTSCAILEVGGGLMLVISFFMAVQVVRRTEALVGSALARQG